jgi:hypothetical protein
MENITVFYSWQSDLINDTNNRTIATCLKQAMLDVEKETENIHLLFDEATRGESGSPEIPTTIFNKISKSDIFVSDITTINSDYPGRKSPNPNVLIELGYAVAQLGWERIIMVYNKNYGQFPSDLPFDLDKRRVSTFTITDKNDKNGRINLIGIFKIAIEGVLHTKPLKPHESKIKDVKTSKREKDLRNLTDVLLNVNLPTMDFFIDNLPLKLIDRILFFWEGFRGVYESTSFYLYDTDIKSSLELFYSTWSKTLNYSNYFSRNGNGHDYHFFMKADVFEKAEDEKAFNQLRKDTQELDSAYKALIIKLRENFVEIDIDEISEKAYRIYLDFIEDSKTRLGI